MSALRHHRERDSEETVRPSLNQNHSAVSQLMVFREWRDIRVFVVLHPSVLTNVDVVEALLVHYVEILNIVTSVAAISQGNLQINKRSFCK